MPPHALCVGGCEFRYYDSKCLIDAETVLDLQMAIIGLLFASMGPVFIQWLLYIDRPLLSQAE